jgi:hypothetical protein
MSSFRPPESSSVCLPYLHHCSIRRRGVLWRRSGDKARSAHEESDSSEQSGERLLILEMADSMAIDDGIKENPTFALHERMLFGGAMAISLPLEFVDVSTVREVSDTQECWADAATDQSIVVEVSIRLLRTSGNKYALPVNAC